MTATATANSAKPPRYIAELVSGISTNAPMHAHAAATPAEASATPPIRARALVTVASGRSGAEADHRRRTIASSAPINNACARVSVP